jgi:crossover junction endodeoxyribonuclease RuvC
VIVLGIDPGKTGGIALLGQDGAILSTSTMPVNEKEIDLTRLALEIDRAQIAARDRGEALRVYLERAGAFRIAGRAQGGVSMFTYGEGFGMIRGLLAGLKVPYTMVRAVDWCRKLHEGLSREASAKERSAQVITRLYPGERFLATARSSVNHEGIVDAVLIARYGLSKELAT